MSATLECRGRDFKGLLCQNPVVLGLDKGGDEGGGISQFVVKYVQRNGSSDAQR